MKIREAKLKDINNIYKLMSLSKELKQSTGDTYFNKKFLRKIVNDKGVILLVVEHDNKIVGVLGAAIWRKTKICYADFIFIDKKYRGKGFGIKLHQYFIKLLKKNGINYLWSIVKQEDHVLQDILKKFKYKKRYKCYYYHQIIK